MDARKVVVHVMQRLHVLVILDFSLRISSRHRVFRDWTFTRSSRPSLSRGENQRVVIARALLSAPQLLLLDEPLTSLDAKLKNAILQQLQTLHREFGVPMLFVTHDPMEATAICEEVILLQEGRIIGRGDPAKLLG
jgi:ABC-type molybdate transport system ATPase subunit